MDYYEAAISVLLTSRRLERETRLAMLSGASKLLLIKLILRIGGRSEEVVRASLVKQLLLSEKVVRQGIRELIDARLLIEVSSRVSGKGSALVTYRLSPKMLDELREVTKPPGVMLFRGIIELLLTGEFLSKQSGQRPRRTYMTPINRLLLSALFARADERGVVHNSSVTELCRIVDLTDDQFVSQMSKLGDQGYIRCRVPGVSGRKLFGRARGLMVLNLGHPDFGAMGMRQWVVVARGTEGQESPKDVWELFDQTKLLRRRVSGSLPWPDRWPVVAPPLTDRAASKLYLELADYHDKWGGDRFQLLLGEEEGRTSPALYKYLEDIRSEVALLIHAHVCERAARVVAGVMRWIGSQKVIDHVDQYLYENRAQEKTYWEEVLRSAEGPVPGVVLVAAMMTLVREQSIRVVRLLSYAKEPGGLPSEHRVQIVVIPPAMSVREIGVWRDISARNRISVVIFPEYGLELNEACCLTVDQGPAPSGAKWPQILKYSTEWELGKDERRAAGLEVTPKSYPASERREAGSDPTTI